MSTQYPSIFNRVASSAKQRCKLTGTPFTLVEIVRQISLRSIALAPSSIQLEQSAVRFVLKSVDIGEGSTVWLPGIDVTSLPAPLSAKELQDARVAVMRPTSELSSHGRAFFRQCWAQLQEIGTSLSDAEAYESLSGSQAYLTRKPSQKKRKEITARDMQILTLELSHVSVKLAIRKFMAGGTAEAEAFLKLLVNLMYYTGIRPIEMWNLELYVPDPNMCLGPEFRDTIKRDPLEANRRGWLIPLEEWAPPNTEDIGQDAVLSTHGTDAPAVLVIGSAKRTNANIRLKEFKRLQILDGISDSLLRMLAQASQLRNCDSDETRKASIRKNALKVLKAICRKDDRLRDRDIDLYAFRHSFASRVKKWLTPAEAAALLGHTSRKTLSGYGVHQARRRRSSSGRDWLPQPEERLVAKIEAEWGFEVLELETEIQPEA